jgi:hypothetical protein
MMTKRHYTVAEIDRMRNAVRWRLFGGKFWINGGGEEAARERATVEDRLRTYMLNGTLPEELKISPDG